MDPEDTLGELEPTRDLEPTAREGPPGETAEPEHVNGAWRAGETVLGRYRIVRPIGHGGMGAVWEAEDLEMGQRVALKLVLEEVTADERFARRLRMEARLARRVTHPNVCRVHDIGEVRGRLFISMELIDGEDVASLLRRVGRLTTDKAVEVGRQVCAGLAAAHSAGVLHRDLKPSNVLIDRSGRARLTDFGLAVTSADSAGLSEVAGTPAYMAPEQLAGAGASERSDIYSMGALLYELLTGRRLLEGRSLAELAARGQALRHGDLLEALDHVGESIAHTVVRCLQRDPAARPRSALEVLTVLCAGDPVGAALAAGLTPSPEMVAASPTRGTLRPLTAWLCLAGIAGSVAVTLALADRVNVVSPVTLTLPPEVLADRARGVVDQLGLDSAAAHEAYGLEYDPSFIAAVGSWRHGARPETGDPPPARFWYRRSPSVMVPEGVAFGLVSYTDPPLVEPGMVGVLLGPDGRLQEAGVIPSPWLAASLGDGTPDWAAALRAAALDGTAMVEVEPTLTPPVFADRVRAWRITDPAVTSVARLEIAALGGRIVHVDVIPPWREGATDSLEGAARGSWLEGLWNVMTLVLILGAAVLAGRNLRRGRGDRSGAFKVALFVLVVHLSVWLLRASHVAAPADEWHVLSLVASRGLYWAGLIWLFYVALEPYVRRYWADSLVGWNRLWTGQLLDAMLARDVLVGALVATAGYASAVLLAGLTSYPGVIQRDLTPLLGTRFYLSAIAESLEDGIYIGLLFLFMLFLVRWWAGSRRLALILFMVLATVAVAGMIANHYEVVRFDPLTLGWTVAWVVGQVVLLTRFGLLAAVVASAIGVMGGQQPVTSDLSAWTSGYTAAGVAIVLGLSIFGALGSTGSFARRARAGARS